MASGRPDWYSSIAMHGKHLTDYVCVAVDADGNMLGIMQGWDGVALQPIAVDDTGVMKANLVLQDLSFLTVRPAYGSAVRNKGSALYASGILQTLWSITGQGVIYDGFIRADDIAVDKCLIVLYVDDNAIFSYHPYQPFVYGFKGATKFRMIPVYFRPTLDSWMLSIASSITFESKFEVKFNQTMGVDKVIQHDFTYALTP